MHNKFPAQEGTSHEPPAPESPAEEASRGRPRHERQGHSRRFEKHPPEHAPEGRGGHHPHHHGERNFWSEWRDERHQHVHGEAIQLGQALSPQEMEAWREFFHHTFGTWPEAHWIFGGRRFNPWHQGMDSFNPFVATLLSKGGGLLPLYVLHLIAQQPRYGNEIMELLAQRTHGQWVSNPGAIYPLLTLLEKEGLIEGKWEDPDKRTIRVYTITLSGQAEVSRITMIVMPKLNETVQVLQDLAAELKSAASATDAPASAEPASAGPACAEPASPEDLAQASSGVESL